MRKLVTKGVVIGLFASTAIYAAGYKIPEQSLNSVALSAAYVANANGADASYYNPANMVWNSDANLIELDMTYINLPKVDYSGGVRYENPFPVYVSADAESEREQFLVPTLHFSSKAIGKWRYGLSIVTPAGLSKRWESSVQEATAQEFSLKVIEINPTIAYKVNDRFAIGGGFRIVYSNGVVKASNEPTYTEDMDGDDISFGYNLAASFRPTKELKLAATYRSKVNLQENGTATGILGGYPYYTSATVSIPLPAVFSLATAYTFNKKTTVEFVYERTYWSAYKTLDFDFSNSTVDQYLGTAIPKNWQDTNTYRIGITHQYNDKLKLMVGFAIDNSPVPSNTLGFELPDADAKLYSCGFEYKYSKDVSFGMAYLYDRKKDRTITESDENEYGIDGTFTHIRAHLLTVSLKYRF